MIEEAERKGILTPDKIVIEASSGNTGIGLALVCAVKGYRCMIAMSEAASIERRKIMKAYGAEIILTPAHKGTDGAIEKVYELARTYPEKYFCTDQFNNPANWLAHYRGTAPEIWRDTKGRVTHVVCGLGTTGTAMGIARYFKDHNLNVKVIGIEPTVGHKIQGLKNMTESYLPGIYDRSLLSQVIMVDDDEAFYWTKWLAKKEGLFVGISSGAALAGALKLAENLEKGFIVVIFPDGGERYLTTSLWNFERETEKEEKLYFFNTLSSKKEGFGEVKRGEVKIYTCGPTLNLTPHIGFYRRMLTSDILKRWLIFKGYKVFHVVNLTDFDDKTINRAIEKGKKLADLTSEVEREFFRDLKWLKILPANVYPKVTQYLQKMIEMALELKSRGLAYERFSSIYFDVSRFPEYGKLSKIDLKAYRKEKFTESESYGKEEPCDFALVKKVSIRELKEGYYVDTPFGKVRPTWHIHCACLALETLGEEFDFFTSGMDLIFPHHENTRAVLKAFTSKEPVKFWLHTNLVYLNGKKMSSSFRVTIEDLKKRGFSGKDLRFWFLRTHYRNPLNFSWEALEEARKIRLKLSRNLSTLMVAEKDEREDEKVKKILEKFKKSWEGALSNDLNTPLAISSFITFLKELIIYANSSGKLPFYEKVWDEILAFNWVLNILSFPEKAREKEVLSLFEKWEEMRREKHFEEADKIREELEKRGYFIGKAGESFFLFKIYEE